MFQNLLDTRVATEPRSYRSVGVAFGLHAAVLAAILAGSYLIVGVIVPPEMGATTIWIANLPPPEGGSGGGRSVAPPPKRPERSAPRPPELTQPVAIPDPSPLETVPPAEAHGVEGTDVGTTIGDTFGPGPGGPGQGNGTGKGIGDGDGPPGSTGDPDGPIFIDATVTKPELLVRVQPRYPETARLARIPGTVLVQAVISVTGQVESVEVISSTNPIFNGAAQDAVRKWRYRPAMQSGRPVAVYFTVEVRFLLQ